MTEIEKLQFRTELVKEAGYVRDIFFRIGKPLTSGKLFKNMPKGIQETMFNIGKKMTEFGAKETKHMSPLKAGLLGIGGLGAIGGGAYLGGKYMKKNQI